MLLQSHGGFILTEIVVIIGRCLWGIANVGGISAALARNKPRLLKNIIHD
jgi:hypothetical protein